MDRAHQVGRDRPLPDLAAGEDPAAALAAGIVHQQRDLTVSRRGRLQLGDLCRIADIGAHRPHLPALLAEHVGGVGELLLVDVGEDETHAGRCEPLRDGEPDATRTAGDDGDTTRGDGGMLVHDGQLSAGTGASAGISPSCRSSSHTAAGTIAAISRAFSFTFSGRLAPGMMAATTGCAAQK
jgi:hypothetical protein